MTDDSARQEIEAAERRRCAALTAGDADALGALMADDLVHIHGNGHMDDKTAYLDGFRNRFRFHRVERGALKIRVRGDVAIVNGPLTQAVSVNGVDAINEITAVVTQSWVRGADGWKQSTCHMGFTSVNGKPLL